MENKKNSQKERKTRILAVGDVHGDLTMINRLADRAKKENVDIIILSGDLTFAERSIKGIIGPFAKQKKPILIIPGNHESVATNALLAELYSPYSKNLHGYYIVKDGIGFFGAGTANMGPHQIKDSEIYDLLKRSHEKIKNLSKKIMVTHIHPENSKMEFSGFKGSKAVKKAIESFQPDIAICSHIHEAAGLEEKIGKTRVINVARKEKVFEI
ncbi:MAG: metallophosphoesterase [Nanoarchaeota archaeon]